MSILDRYRRERPASTANENRPLYSTEHAVAEHLLHECAPRETLRFCRSLIMRVSSAAVLAGARPWTLPCPRNSKISMRLQIARLPTHLCTSMGNWWGSCYFKPADFCPCWRRIPSMTSKTVRLICPPKYPGTCPLEHHDKREVSRLHGVVPGGMTAAHKK